MSYDKNKTRALRQAISGGEVERVSELLVDPAVDLHCESEQWDSTPFMAACRVSEVEMIRAFLDSERQIDYNQKREHGQTALFKVAAHDVLQVLLDDPRIDVNVLDSNGDSVVTHHLQETKFAHRIVMLMLASPRFTQINAVNNKGESALDIAIRLNMKGTVNMLWDYFMDPVGKRTKIRKELGHSG